MEQEFLNWLKQRVSEYSEVPIGIGDDAALVKTSEQSLVCSDMVAEGTHFSIDSIEDFRRVGRKALAINLSDIASMGGSPQFATLSLLVSKKYGLEAAKNIAEGFLELAKEFSVILIGGDTCSWDGPCIIDVTVIGKPIRSNQILKRSDLENGDSLFVTGHLGGSN